MKRKRSTDRNADLAGICQRYDVAILYAFGSRAKEMQGWLIGERESLQASNADLDIGVKALIETEWHLDDKIDLSYALEDLFEGGSVDLIDLSRADPFLAANVIRGERLYADDEYLADEYDLFVLRRAGDLIPLENERLDLILNRKRQPITSRNTTS